MNKYIRVIVFSFCYLKFICFAQVLPFGTFAALRQVIGENDVSCQLDYSMNYSGLKDPISFNLYLQNFKNGCRVDCDLEKGTNFGQKLQQTLAPYKADKFYTLYLSDDKKCYMVWPTAHSYCEISILQNQMLFLENKLKWFTSNTTNEQIENSPCKKLKLNSNSGLEAYIWIKKGDELPVKLEMKADDQSGQNQSVVLIFKQWHQQVLSKSEKSIPQLFDKIRDVRDILPKDYFQKVNASINTNEILQSSDAEYFKSILEKPQKCVSELLFERINVNDLKTNVFLCKKQKNAIFFRQLLTLDDADKKEQSQGHDSIIISKYSQKSWMFRDHVLFSNGDPLETTGDKQKWDEMSRLESVAENIISEPLKMGILFAVNGTFRWIKNDFIADDKDDGKLYGHLSLDDKGLPKRVVYFREKTRISYQVDYKYESLSFSNKFPTVMELAYANEGAFADYFRAKPYKIYHVCRYSNSDVLLDESGFSLEKYLKYNDPNSYKPNVTEIQYSNHVPYVNIAGKMMKVSTATELTPVKVSFENRRFIVIFLMGLTSLVFLVVTVKMQYKNKIQKQKKVKHEN